MKNIFIISFFPPITKSGLSFLCNPPQNVCGTTHKFQHSPYFKQVNSIELPHFGPMPNIFMKSSWCQKILLFGSQPLHFLIKVKFWSILDQFFFSFEPFNFKLVFGRVQQEI